ncbi:hypothetical protein CBR_g30937 [Chara braunii]|uniref:CCHC-type domain-containing protein n=1 Tax=Chara braunii TaxID=69332 RepID=A0A388LDU7_CHABU|nr:hypothetical protein CBR_g30937 [Chara braunii]|eukprot:GBG80475.1 hypothetical protein CBR_g30937 [Chara braunii]
MPDADEIERGPAATPEGIVKVLEKWKLARLQVSKVNIFLFEGERVSKWLELLEQVTTEVSEADKFKVLPRYIWWEIRPKIMKIAVGAGGDWAKFKGEMQRRFKLGDDVLTKTDLEILQRDKFSTVGAFTTTFKKMARKVSGLAEEEKCVTFFGHFKNWEASALTKKAAPGKKLTWAAIKEGVLEGELDQVDIFQMPKARKKRKALDATTSDGRDFKKMVEDAVAQLDAEKEAKAARKTMAAPQTIGKTKKAVVPEEEEEEEEEPEPLKNDEDEGLISTNYDGDMYDKFGHYLDPKIPGGTRKEALRRVEADAPPAPPATFRMWQEKEVRCDIKVEEVEKNEEVEQGRKVGTIKEEPIIVESDDEIEEDYWNEPQHAKIGEDCWRETRQTMERMKDLVAKVGRYQQKLTDMCTMVEEWRGKEPLVYLYDMGPGSQGGSGSLPGVTTSGPAPRSDMAYRPPSRTGRVTHAVRTRAKGPVSPKEPAKDVPEPLGEKEVVDVPEGEHDEDDRLRKEEDEKVEQRVKKRGAKPDTDKASAEEAVRDTVLDQEEVADQEEGDNVIHEREDDDFEEGEIREAFRAEEYEGVYLELGMLLSCERRSLKKRRREPEVAERMTFEQGMSSATQRKDRRKEHRSHRHEREGELGGPGVPPQPAQMEVDCPMSDIEPDIPHEPHVQEHKEEQCPQEKELDRKERATRDQEIKVQLRMKNLVELHKRMQQGKEPEEVDDKSGNDTCTQEEDLPLFSEVWVSFVKLMDAAGMYEGHHQKMGVKLVSTDLLNLRGMMKEGFAAARASYQKVGEKLMKVAQKVQAFEIRERPAAETFKCHKEEEKADQQEGEEIPLIDKEMLEPQETLDERDSEVGGFEWRMSAGLTLGQESARPEERPPAEAVRVETVLHTTQGETMGRQEGQESVGQTMVETEPRVDLKGCQNSAVPQDMSLVAGLRDALGSWATGSGPEGRVDEQVMQADDRATCPTSPEVPQQEVTSKISTVPSSVPSQEGDKMSQKKVGKCFYCKKGKHRSDDCPKSLKDEANGMAIRESYGVWRDRNGVLVPKTRDGVRAQLYRQLQEVTGDQE